MQYVLATAIADEANTSTDAMRVAGIRPACSEQQWHDNKRYMIDKKVDTLSALLLLQRCVLLSIVAGFASE